MGVNPTPGTRHEGMMVAHNPQYQPKLELPFKPFTLAEVIAISGASPKTVDMLVGDDKVLVPVLGLGVVGLHYMQVVALLAAQAYLEAGADPQRAKGVAEYLANISKEYLDTELKRGNDFVVPGYMLGPGQAGVLVKSPKSALGTMLNMTRLMANFLYNLKKVFPNG